MNRLISSLTALVAAASLQGCNNLIDEESVPRETEKFSLPFYGKDSPQKAVFVTYDAKGYKLVFDGIAGNLEMTYQYFAKDNTCVVVHFEDFYIDWDCNGVVDDAKGFKEMDEAMKSKMNRDLKTIKDRLGVGRIDALWKKRWSNEGE